MLRLRNTLLELWVDTLENNLSIDSKCIFICGMLTSAIFMFFIFGHSQYVFLSNAFLGIFLILASRFWLADIKQQKLHFHAIYNEIEKSHDRADSEKFMDGVFKKKQ